MTPKKIGRYVVEKELGRGGMAVVYLVSDPLVKRKVAIKLLPSQFTDDPHFRARFQREAQVIASLDHPAIVPIYDFGEHEGQPFIVMRYMPGGSLADRLKDNGPVSPTEAGRILAQIGSALDEAHAKGIVHRDLKPGNILFDHRDDAAIADFGIVKLTESSSTLTGTNMIGTPGYMSPEQARGDIDIDRRSDIYALGAILFEMLTGEQPYQADTPMGVAIKHVIEEVPHILRVKPDLPPDFDYVVSRAMAKEPGDRYASATELAKTISSVAAGETIKSAPSIDVTRIEKPTPSPTVPPRATTHPRPRSTTPPQAAPRPISNQKTASQKAAAPPRSTPQPASTAIPQPTPATAVPTPQEEVKKRPVWLWLVGGLLVLGLCVGGIIGGYTLAAGLFSGDEADTLETPETAIQVVEDGTPTAAPAGGLDEVQAAVVQVVGRGAPLLEELIGSGSGFVSDESGLVLTNYHLVEGASNIEIIDSDGRTTTAEIVGASPCDDLALLQLDDASFPVIPTGSAVVEVDSPIFVIGFPEEAAEQAATAGTITSMDEAIANGWGDFPAAFQVDAAASPGLSGGPLVTEDGAVIGLTSIELESGQVTAVSLDLLRPIIDQLEAGNKLHWLGVNAGLLPAGSGFTPQDGLFVFAVSAGSPAEQTGLRPGDFIIEAGGTAVGGGNLTAYCRVLREYEDGDELEIVVLRDGDTLTGVINGRPLSEPGTPTPTATTTPQASATLRPTNTPTTPIETATNTPAPATNTAVPATNTSIPPTNTPPPPTSPPPTSPPPTSPPPTSPPPTSPPPTSPPPTNTPEPP